MNSGALKEKIERVEMFNYPTPPLPSHLLHSRIYEQYSNMKLKIQHSNLF